jgi:hypothetical protein
MEQERDFKGVWIPKEIWLSKNLTLQEKVMLVEIDSLDNEKGCFATNQYFADFFDISKTRVSLILKSLIEKGYITSKIVYKEGSKQILSRVLNICKDPIKQNDNTLFNKTEIPYLTKVKEGYLTKVKDPIQQKLKDNNIYNNIYNNNINNNIDNKKEKNIKKERHKYGDYGNVLFTDEQYEKLKKEFPDDYKFRIQNVDDYAQSTGKKYKDYLATIRTWARRDKQKKTNNNNSTGNIFFDILREEGKM